MLESQTRAVDMYFREKYNSGLLDYCYSVPVSGGMSIEIGATKKVFHLLVEPELQRFCVEYRLGMRVSYRLTLSDEEWRQSFLDDTGVPEDEIILIHVLFRDSRVEVLHAP